MASEPQRKMECYLRVLRINPKNAEAKIWIARLKAQTQPLPRNNPPSQFKAAPPYKRTLRWVGVLTTFAFLFSAASYVVARANPESAMAKILVAATPTMYVEISKAGDVALQTRSALSAKYPQYAMLVDALVGFAVTNADNGLEGAPERPGAEILPSDEAAAEAKIMVEKSLPQPGSLSSISLTERQLTSWLAMKLKETPDLPFSDAQVYLREGKIKIWGMATGGGNSTSALAVGSLGIGANKEPKIQIESIQIGKQVIPQALAAQLEAWVNQIFLEVIEEHAPGLEIMNVNISSGMLTISGMR